jgi:hypothetical protein
MIRVALVLLLASCGYRPLYGAAQSERYAVVLASTEIPDRIATDEVVAGVRDELAKMGAYASGNAYPRIEVEVLRADEASEGIAARPNRDGVLLPEARATEAGIVARAWLVRAHDAPRERDTGDVRAAQIVDVAPDARSATFRGVDALRASARRVGRTMGQRLLGLPAASDE